MKRLDRGSPNALSVWLLSALFVVGVTHAEPLIYEQAKRAMRDSLPQLAINKLRQTLSETSLAPVTRADATCLLAEAYIQTGQTDEARSVLAPLVANGNLQARLLRAHAFARSGAWQDARDAYSDLVALPSPPMAARLGAAESWQALGETSKAVALLEPIVRSGNAPAAAQLRLATLYVENGQLSLGRRVLAAVTAANDGDRLWKRYVEGRILLREQQPDAAGAAFNEVLSSPGNVTENLAAAATLGAAEVKMVKQGPEAADKVLETYVWNNADSPWIEMVFRRLDQVYAAERKPEDDQLQRWATHPQTARAAFARFYLGKLQFRATKLDKAISTLDVFVARYPTHRFVPFAQLMRAEALSQKGSFGDAIQALEAASRAAGSAALRAEIDLRTGVAHLQQQQFLLAATSLDRAAENSENLREIATYNAALAWLGQGNLDRFQQEYRRLQERGADTWLRGNLALEEALTRARTGDADAEAALHQFMEQFPKHPRTHEASIALAEVKMKAGDLEDAARLLRVANSKMTGKGIDEQAACLAIFLSDSKTPRDDAETIRMGKAFLLEHPNSQLVPDVRMKLGQIYFRQSDYPNAGTQFGTFAHDWPKHPSAETALFLAGQAAMRLGPTDTALSYFDEVVQRNGPLKLHAREQQAIIQVRLGKEQEAVALYDLIIESRQPSPDPELRNSALIGKGEALALLGGKDPQQLPAAFAVYDELANSSDAGAAWRDQALYKKAKLLADQPGRKSDALALYNDILDRNMAATEREFFWFYKAGFEAGAIFEQQQQWSAAIEIYEKMARLEGPHALEAREKARRLRVDHFVWD